MADFNVEATVTREKCIKAVELFFVEILTVKLPVIIEKWLFFEAFFASF